MRINDKVNYNKIWASISMNNLKSLMEYKDYSTTKVAANTIVSERTIQSYIDNETIPSLPALISIADYFNVNLDYLLDRCDNPIKLQFLTKISKNSKDNLLIQSLLSLPEDKKVIVEAFIKGLLSK